MFCWLGNFPLQLTYTFPLSFFSRFFSFSKTVLSLKMTFTVQLCSDFMLRPLWNIFAYSSTTSFQPTLYWYSLPLLLDLNCSASFTIVSETVPTFTRSRPKKSISSLAFTCLETAVMIPSVSLYKPLSNP